MIFVVKILLHTFDAGAKAVADARREERTTDFMISEHKRLERYEPKKVG
jgi:hypothetical protein